MTTSVKEALLSAARALDDGKPDDARTLLRAAPLTPGEHGLRPVALALWQRLLADAAGMMSADDRRAIDPSLKAVTAAVKDASYIWNAYEAIPVLEATIGAGDTAALFATALWDRVLDGPEGLFTSVFELLFRGGNPHCLEAWRQYLDAHKDYVPIYWHWLLLTKTFARGHRAAARAGALLEEARRADLLPLFDVYLQQMRQAPVADIVATALALADPAQRLRVADYMTGMGYMPDELPVVVSAFAKLAPNDAASIAFMAARLANAEGRWHDAVAQTTIAAADQRYKDSAALVQAHALARLHEKERARDILDAVSADPKAADWLHARAMFIRVTAQQIEDGVALPEEKAPPRFAVTPGRPLAQSLWVGKRLRWIGRLAIKSYLDHGWRFQLYAYDDVADVPPGCEVLSASAIIPEKEVFTEGTGSGLHAGSVGAFSDLFRYRLLYERGGMWTDTDVVNFRRFDPDGRKFVSTELSDAGLVSLNGAMMAAPARDPFVARAYERAAALLKSDKMFFTRIGPYLLAELVAEMGSGVVELMSPGFLSPISWMNTGSLLQPYESVAARPAMRDAVNLHVYTEMWRLLGLGLDAPPNRETFIAGSTRVISRKRRHDGGCAAVVADRARETRRFRRPRARWRRCRRGDRGRG
jgi:hypothetical protein